jgi:hypothetical protein
MSGWNDQVEAMDREIIAHLDESTLAYVPFGGAPVSFEGVFDERAADLAGGEPGISGARPMVFGRLSDLPEDPDREVLGGIVADGVSYRIVDVQKDGQGAVRLFLHRAETPFLEHIPGAPVIDDVVED